MSYQSASNFFKHACKFWCWNVTSEQMIFYHEFNRLCFWFLIFVHKSFLWNKIFLKKLYGSLVFCHAIFNFFAKINMLLFLLRYWRLFVKRVFIFIPASNFSCQHYFSWCLHQNFDADMKILMPAFECFLLTDIVDKKEWSFLSLFCHSQHWNVICNRRNWEKIEKKKLLKKGVEFFLSFFFFFAIANTLAFANTGMSFVIEEIEKNKKEWSFLSLFFFFAIANTRMTFVIEEIEKNRVFFYRNVACK